MIIFFLSMLSFRQAADIDMPPYISLFDVSFMVFCAASDITIFSPFEDDISPHIFSVPGCRHGFRRGHFASYAMLLRRDCFRRDYCHTASCRLIITLMADFLHFVIATTVSATGFPCRLLSMSFHAIADICFTATLCRRHFHLFSPPAISAMLRACCTRRGRAVIAARLRLMPPPRRQPPLPVS
jgi:hypothetical protein